MSQRSTLLLEHHLKELRLPGFLRGYGKMAAQCTAENVDHPEYLLRLADLELIDRHQRMVERRIRAARFPAVKSLNSFDFLLLEDHLGYLSQGTEKSEVLFTLIAERYESRSLGITSTLVFSEWERILANPMATAADIERVVHRSVILEFEALSYWSDAAQQRGRGKEVNRQECLTQDTVGQVQT